VELRSHKIDDDVTKKGERNLAMRTKLFLTGIAALFLATGTVIAALALATPARAQWYN